MQGACCLLGTGTVRLRIASPVMVMRGRNLSLALEKGVSWMQRPDQSSPVVVCLTLTSEAHFRKRWNKHSCPSLLPHFPFLWVWFTPSSSSLFNVSGFSAAQVCLSRGGWAQTTFVSAVLTQVELLPHAKTNTASSSYSSPRLVVVVLRAERVRIE